MTPDGRGAGHGHGERRAPPPPSTPPPPGEAWTILRLVLWSAGYLAERGVAEARLDAEHLLAHALGTERLQLYLHFDRPLTPDELETFKPLLLRRAAREPLQYVVGHAQFRELDLLTDRRALIPRPETEELVDVVLAWARERARSRAPDVRGRGAPARAPGSPERAGGPSAAGDPGARALTAADIGTGTGCIALSLAREGPFVRVLATDDSADALALAAENARRSELEGLVELRAGPLLEPLADERVDVLVSNPPYVAEGERGSLEPEVRDWEPAGALFAGSEGTEVLAALVAGAPAHLAEGGLLALEVGAGHAESVVALAEATEGLATPRIHRDLGGHARIVTAERA